MWHFYIHYPEFLQPGTHKTRQLSDYDIFQTVFIPNQVHTTPIWVAHLIRVGHLGISFSCSLKGIKVPFIVFWGLQFLTGMLKDQDTPSGGFIAKQVDGVGDKRLGYATTVVVRTCKPFWRTSRLGIICLNLPKY